MSYRDPYQQSGDYYGHEFDPYSTSQHPQNYPTYGQTGAGLDKPVYNEPQIAPQATDNGPQRQATMRSFLTGDGERTRPNFTKEVPPLPVDTTFRDGSSGFEQGEFSAVPGRAGKGFYDFNERSSQTNPWTRGSRGSCIIRFFCCTLGIALFLFISICLTLLLWIRPPSVSLSAVGTTTTGDAFQLTTSGITINLDVNLTVNNPNYMAITFSQITADIFYPINNTAIGSGTEKNIDFPPHTNSNFTFPFSLVYSASLDPNKLILQDLVSKCGATESQITVNYKITPGIRVLFVTVSPTISNSFSFPCPIDSATLAELEKIVGLTSRGPDLNAGSALDMDT